jgi:flagellar protein FliS
MAVNDPRARYVADAVTTASPARLLVMLYDKLVLDCEQAEQALRAGERHEANQRLQHGQDILMELLSSLDPSAWDGGPALASLYTFLSAELVKANIAADPDKVAECRALVAELRDAWRQAAAEVGSGAARTSPSASLGVVA